MAQKLVAHLTTDQLREHYHSSTRNAEQIRWHALLLKSEGHSAKSIAAIVHRHPDSIRVLIRRYNADGPSVVRDKRADNGGQFLLPAEQLDALREVLKTAPPDHGVWTTAKVAEWIANEIGREQVHSTTGFRYLRRVKHSHQVPRPSHLKSDKAAQEQLKKGASASPRLGERCRTGGDGRGVGTG